MSAPSPNRDFNWSRTFAACVRDSVTTSCGTPSRKTMAASLRPATTILAKNPGSSLRSSIAATVSFL